MNRKLFAFVLMGVGLAIAADTAYDIWRVGASPLRIMLLMLSVVIIFRGAWRLYPPKSR